MKTAVTAALMGAFLSAIYGIYRIRESVGGERFAELVSLVFLGAMWFGLLVVLWAFCSRLAFMIVGSGEKK